MGMIRRFLVRTYDVGMKGALDIIIGIDLGYQGLLILQSRWRHLWVGNSHTLLQIYLH